MKTRTAAVLTCLLGLALIFSVPLHAAESALWSYDENKKNGPEHWGSLSKDYHLCKDGKQQSPIDIDSTMLKKLSPLHFQYESMPEELVNNGHTIQINYAPGSSLNITGDQYELLQLHFHTPSEHTTIGEDHAMEVHFVHKNAKGKLVVVGVFIKQGSAHPLFEKILALAPKSPASVKLTDATLKASRLMAQSSAENYVTYSGSLTTPPCTEGVRWYVLREMLEFSAAQVEQFSHLVHGANSRPEQPLNARAIFRDKD